MLIDEQEGLSQSQSENSDDASSEASDVDEEVKTPKSSTTQELSLANGSFLGRAIFTPDSTLPIGMKRSSQVMLYAVPYDPAIHACMPAATVWSLTSCEAKNEIQNKVMIQACDESRPVAINLTRHRDILLVSVLKNTCCKT